MLNEIWKKILKLEKTTKTVNNKYHRILKRKTRYSPSHLPNLIATYQLEKLILEAKATLIQLAIDLTLEKDEVENVAIPRDVNNTFQAKEGFDELDIEQYIKENFVANADGLAKEQILDKARKLLPYYHEKLTVNDLLSGKTKQTLTLGIYWSYGDSLSQHSQECVEALERLIRISLFREKPSKVSIPKRRYTHGTLPKTDGKVEKFTFYKNGKLVIKFTDRKYARKIAKALLA